MRIEIYTTTRRLLKGYIARTPTNEHMLRLRKGHIVGLRAVALIQQLAVDGRGWCSVIGQLRAGVC